MDNGAGLPLYAGTCLGEGTCYTRITWRGGYIHREGSCLSMEVGCGRLPRRKGQFSLERKSFSDGAGLGETQFPPIPQPENRVKSMRRG